MSAKKTKSPDPKKTDQTKPADKADDIEIPEIVEPALDATEVSDPVEAVETDAGEQTLQDDPVEIADTAPQDTDDAEPQDGADTVAADEDTPSDPVSETDPEDQPDAAPEDPEDVQETEHHPDTQEAQPDEDTPSDVVEATTPEPQEKIVERVIETKSVFVPAIFGGLVAGLLGLAVGASDSVSSLLSSDTADPVETVTAADLAAVTDQIAALEARLSEPVEAPDLSGIQAEFAESLAAQAETLGAADAALSDRLTALSAQLSDLEQAPVSSALSEDVVAAYESELAAVQAALAQQRADVEAMIAEAAALEADASENARAAQAQAAATRLFAALDAGAAYSAEVTELQSLGVTVPDALMAGSEGVTALGALQADFPSLARDALAQARSETAGSGGFGSFLQRQLGARSVTPRDGDDPDAVLSRAEAALAQGDITQALAEIDALPDVAKAILADWAASAETRQSALTAADDLAQSLASN